MLFTTAAVPTIRRQREKIGPYIGALFTPRHFRTPPEDMPWAADNDGFGGFKAGPFLRMLGVVADRPNCVFVAAPDVVGDARTTLSRFMRWQPIIKEAGLPVAYVLQDGLEGVGVPWDFCEAVFVGGSTEFKLGDVAARTCREAAERGKWVHVGRVNSLRRMEFAQSIGADSIDGTKWSRWAASSEHQLHGLAFAQASLAHSQSDSRKMRVGE